MINEKKKFILQIMCNENSVIGYEEKYGVVDICSELQYVINSKDGEGVDLFLYLSELINYDFSCINTLNSLLIATWHEKHEDICRILSRYKHPSSIHYLYQAALLDLTYREYDEDYVLADKSMRLISLIGGKAATDKLNILSASSVHAISERAKKYLRRNE